MVSLSVLLGKMPGADAPAVPLDPTLAPSHWWPADPLLIFVPLGLWLYLRMLRRALGGQGRVRVSALGWPEALISVVLTGFLVGLIATIGFHSAPSGKAAEPTGSMIVAGVLVDSGFKLLLVAGLLFGLASRGIRLGENFGLDRLPLGGVILRSFGFILLALPLVDLFMHVSRKLAGGGEDSEAPQEAIRLFMASHDLLPKLAMIVAAVVIAPIVEETFFRGYLYGVTRRFFGTGAAIIVNAALFAAIHLHLPSFGGLFMLAVCLTLAYEATGSILVPMTMHALFNSISVAILILTSVGS